MKKFLAILMALALVLSLAACGEKAAPDHRIHDRSDHRVHHRIHL